MTISVSFLFGNYKTYKTVFITVKKNFRLQNGYIYIASITANRYRQVPRIYEDVLQGKFLSCPFPPNITNSAARDLIQIYNQYCKQGNTRLNSQENEIVEGVQK